MSVCACIKKREFDIVISYRGCEILLLEDQSIWVGEKPKTYDITLTALSRGMAVNVTLDLNKKTQLTSKDIFKSETITCLPDDIYCITTESCGYKLSINRAYLCNMELKVNEMVAKFANTMSEDERKIIQDFKLQIDAIKINTEKGNLETARKIFKSVKEKLNHYKCDNC